MPHVLLIDDEKLVRLTVRKILEAEGYEVSEAEDGMVGLESFKQQPFDLVITDIVMPEREGIETIAAIRKIKPDQKIIAISGGGRNKNTDYLNTAVLQGAADKLSKPFSRSELLSVVTRCLA
jgi:YesN/AraC family two-component response regulator